MSELSLPARRRSSCGDNVIYRSPGRRDSAGFEHPQLFQSLGDRRHRPGSAEQRTEEEFLLQNMVKDAMADAAAVARRYGVSIAVRGTHVRSHLGIESGLPTKGQEWKNKTSSDADLILCEELVRENVGGVVHYDPRLGWTSTLAIEHAKTHDTPFFGTGEPTEDEWRSKLTWVNEVRRPFLLKTHGAGFVDVDDDELQRAFLDRAKEYAQLDHGYRHGEFRDCTVLAGPMLRLALRPNENMVGDHDLFAFADWQGAVVGENTNAQRDLQDSTYFQAQHGGIYYWNTDEKFYGRIKATIMAAHCAPHGSPLVVIHPDETITAMFHDAEQNRLVSVWDCPRATAWLATTTTGARLLAGAATSAATRSPSSELKTPG